jgi:hypothetical protein
MKNNNNITEDNTVVYPLSGIKDIRNKIKKGFLGNKNISSASISNIYNDNNNNAKQSEKASW